MLFHSSELHPTTHLLMNQAEERTGERQTFELGAEEVRNRRGYACKVYRKTRKKNQGVTEIGKVEEQCLVADVEKSGKLYFAEEWRWPIFDKEGLVNSLLTNMPVMTLKKEKVSKAKSPHVLNADSSLLQHTFAR